MLSYNSRHGFDEVNNSLLSSNDTVSKFRVIIEINRALGDVSLLVTTLCSVFSQVHILRVYDNLPYIVAELNSKDLLTKIKSLPFVENIYLDREVKVLPNSVSTNQFVVWNSSPDTIGVPFLWKRGLLGRNITIAILDTGIDTSHPDLDDLDDNAMTLDPKVIGFKDFVNGYDDLNPADGINAYDDNGHGTAVAGIISGTGFASNKTYMGIAPKSKILAIKVVDSQGNGNISNLLAGIDFAMGHNVNIISMSLGAPESSHDPIAQAVSLAVSRGIIVVAAAGNDGPYFGTINSPGISPSAITVAASFGNITLASWSSRGPTILSHIVKPDITAPGVNVITTRATHAKFPAVDARGYYMLFSGTSAATPFISGVVALLLQAYPHTSPLEIKTALMKTAKKLGFSWIEEGAGLVNATAAFLYLNSTNVYAMIYPESLNITYILPEIDYGPLGILVSVQGNVNSISYTLSGNLSKLYTYDHLIYIGNGYFFINSTFEGKINTSYLGTFVGTFDVLINSSYHLKSTITVNILPYHGRVIWDMYHQSKDDADSPDAAFIDAFSKNDMSVELLTSPITTSALQFADVLIINDIEVDLTSSEITAIVDWVNNGGTLIVFNGFYNETSGEVAFAYNSMNSLLNNFGIGIENKSIGVGPTILSGIVYTGRITNHPIMKNVSSLFTILGAPFKIIDSSKAMGLFYIDNTSDALVAYAKSGNGQVIALGDDNIFWEEILYSSYVKHCDNPQLLYNIASFVIPHRPVIYNFALSRVNEGYLIKLEVFNKKGIKSVKLSILNFDGSWSNKTLYSDNGYTYTIKLPDSIFTYDAFIIIEGADGNIRVVHIVVKSLLSLPILLLMLFAGIILIGAAFILMRKRSKPPYHFYYDPQYSFGP